MFSILVTAIGSFSADIVIKTLKEAGHKVIGCDIYPKEWIVNAYNVNSFYQVPYTHDKEGYINSIKNICKEHDVQYIFPLTDPEVDILSGIKKELQRQGVFACISDDQTIKLCRNKYLLPKFLLEQGIKQLIPTKLLFEVDNNHVQLPVFIKPVLGRSSQGCRPVYDYKEYETLKEVLNGNENIVQPLLNGNIITVDVIRDSKTDDVVCIGRRELLRNSSGAGTTVEIIENKELGNLSAEIARKVDIIGAVNFEFIQTNSGEVFFLEINPRFSGGVKFSCMAGYDVVSNHLRCFTNQPIDKKVIKKMIIARKYNEFVTSLD
ncbi:ATP-grasp domain-containing protein [Chengkuizengella sp. SCS-71B]|uniref:ATP-grasp domain-containing protein n=1 Tax=Chengkuizengella sp. SCS-71B TaxID=3115290 RepID=UPI0032C2247A